MATINGYVVKNILQNRGRPRIWLQGADVVNAGLEAGQAYEIEVVGGSFVIRANPNGSRVISAKRKNEKVLPIIDINSRELLSLFDGMSAVRVVQFDGEIHVTPLATELKKRERKARVRRKLTKGEPLAVGSLSHGGGLLSHAVHAGLEKAGVPAELAFANEIRSDLVEHAQSANDVWRRGSIPIVAPMQEVAFDAVGLAAVPKVEILEGGLPCSGAAQAGRARRGTAMPEEHPDVGHLVVAALVILNKANPVAVLMENVVPYSSSASAAIIRNQLRDMGYVLHERVFDGSEFNAIECRKRWFMVAVTEGIEFDWDMVVFPDTAKPRLGDYLDDVPSDSPRWSEMRGLKEKMVRDAERGNRFKMQTFGPESTRIGTLTKGLSKNRSTDPKIEHPTNPDLLRIPTAAEHARIKGWNVRLVEGLSETIANEMLGQSVLSGPPTAIAEAIGKSLRDAVEKGFGSEPEIQDVAAYIKSSLLWLADELGLELRKPVAQASYSGPIVGVDGGVAIQHVGNGVGIAHKLTELDDVRMGADVMISYGRSRASCKVIRRAPVPGQAELDLGSPALGM